MVSELMFIACICFGLALIVYVHLMSIEQLGKHPNWFFMIVGLGSIVSPLYIIYYLFNTIVIK